MQSVLLRTEKLGLCAPAVFPPTTTPPVRIVITPHRNHLVRTVITMLAPWPQRGAQRGAAARGVAAGASPSVVCAGPGEAWRQQKVSWLAAPEPSATSGACRRMAGRNCGLARGRGRSVLGRAPGLRQAALGVRDACARRCRVRRPRCRGDTTAVLNRGSRGSPGRACAAGPAIHACRSGGSPSRNC